MVKIQGLWYITLQEDSYPSDLGRAFGRSASSIIALPGRAIVGASNTIKHAIGLSTFIVAAVAARTGIID
jgi:hypothetical protein